MRLARRTRQIMPTSETGAAPGVGQMAGRARAQIGASISDAGQGLMAIASAGIRDDLIMIESQAERRMEEFSYAFGLDLEQRRDLAEPDASGRTGFERVPEQFQRQWQQGMDRLMGAVPTPVQNRLSVYANERYPLMAAKVSAKAAQLQSAHWRSQTTADVISSATKGDLASAQLALARGRDWLDPDEVVKLDAEAARLYRDFHEDKSWSQLQDMAETKGWAAVGPWLNDPKNQRAMDLNPDELNRLTARVGQQAAVEANQQDQAHQQAKADALGKLTTALWHGELLPEHLDRAMEAGLLEPSNYDSMMTRLMHPREASREEILAANVATSAAVERVVLGVATVDQGFEELFKHVGKFSPAESARYVDQIIEAGKVPAKVRAQAAKESQEAAKYAAAQAKADAKAALFVGVFRGNITDVTVVDQAAVDQVITAAEYEGLRRVLTDPKRAGAVEVLNAHVQVQQAVQKVQGRAMSPQDAMNILAQHSPNFTAAEGAKYSKDIFDAADPQSALTSPLARKGKEYLDQLRTAKLFGGDDVMANSRKWLSTVDEYDAWVKENANATPEQHQAFLKYLTTPVLMSWWENLSPQQTLIGVRRLPPEAQAQWTATGGKASDEWVESWRKIRKPLTEDVARHYWQISGGNEAKAKAMATEDGYFEESAK